MNSKLYVGNLAPHVSEGDLRDLFSRAGTVAAVEVMLDPTSGQSRGYAFVTMATPELAATALNDFHSYELGGRYITVTEAQPPREPKGLMSEGFDFHPLGAFRAGDRPHKNRKQPRHPTRRRGRGR
ncbi:MAG: RNA recognition motif domain-containing protein [Limisphaerales bacterium]